MFRAKHTNFVLCFVTLLAIGLTGCNRSTGWLANNEGTSFYRQGNYSMAQNAFQRAAIDDPDNVNFQYNLAMAMKKQGNMQGAEQILHKTLNQVPNHQPSHHGLAMVLKEQGRTDEAMKLMQQWVAVEPHSPQPHIELAWLQRELGDTAGAENSLRQALRTKPTHPVAMAQLGQLYEETGRPAQAVAMYQGSLQGSWRQPKVQKRLANLQGTQAVQRQRARMAAMAPTYGVPYGGTATAAHSYGWQPHMANAPYGPTMTGMQQVPMLQSADMQPTPVPSTVNADPAHSGTVSQ